MSEAAGSSNAGGPLTALLARTYHEAALTGVDMYAVVDALEAVRSAAGRRDDRYSALRELENGIGRAADNGLRDLLASARDAQEADLFAEVVEAARSDTIARPDAGLTPWLHEFTRAMSAWRVSVCQALCREAPPLAQGDEATVARLHTALGHMIVGTWGRALDEVEWLANHDAASIDDSARLLCRAAQIRMYHTSDLNGADELVKRASGLSVAPFAAAEVECARGQVHLIRGEMDAARQCFERGLRADPEFVENYAFLGDTYLGDTHSDEATAEAWYRRAIVAHPGSNLGYTRLVTLFARPASYAQRRHEIQPLVERAVLVSHDGAFDVLTRAAYDVRSAAGPIGDIDGLRQALGWAERATRLQPDRGEGHYAHGEALADLERWSDALNAFVAARRSDPENYGDIKWSVLGRPGAVPTLLAALDDESSREIARDALLRSIENRLGDPDAVPDSMATLDSMSARLGEEFTGERENAIGDVHFALGDMEESRAAFERAIAHAPDVALYHRNLAAALGRLRRWTEARDAAAAAHALDADEGWFAREVASIANLEGHALYESGDFSAAAVAYREAAARQDAEAVYHSNLALALEGISRSSPRESPLVEAETALARASALRPEHGEYLLRLRKVRSRLRAARRFGERALFFEAAPEPLSISVAADLVPFVSSGEPAILEEVQTAVDSLRAWIVEDYGVRTPPLKFRSLGASEPGQYVISIAGVPAIWGVLDHALRLVCGSYVMEELSRIGVVGSATTHPLSGEAAAWAPASARKLVEEAGLQMWNLMDYPLNQLAFLLVQRLSDVVGHQETSDWVKRSGSRHAASIDASPDLLGRLVSALRGLVAERVPIIDSSEIIECVIERTASGATDTEIVEALRALPPVRQRLPGNEVGTMHLELNDSMEAALASSLHRRDVEPSLALTPELTSELLSWVRAAVTRHPRMLCLVTGVAELRPFLRRLLEAEFPQLWVLSRSEIDGRHTAELLLPEEYRVPEGVGLPMESTS